MMMRLKAQRETLFLLLHVAQVLPSLEIHSLPYHYEDH